MRAKRQPTGRTNERVDADRGHHRDGRHRQPGSSVRRHLGTHPAAVKQQRRAPASASPRRPAAAALQLEPGRPTWTPPSRPGRPGNEAALGFKPGADARSCRHALCEDTWRQSRAPSGGHHMKGSVVLVLAMLTAGCAGVRTDWLPLSPPHSATSRPGPTRTSRIFTTGAPKPLLRGGGHPRDPGGSIRRHRARRGAPHASRRSRHARL